MTVWTTDDFMEKFQSGSLGRKTQHGTLYTVNIGGTNHQVLMGKRSSGETPLAVYHDGFCIFNPNWESGRGRGSDFTPNFTTPFTPGDAQDFEVMDKYPIYGGGTKWGDYVLFRFGQEQFILDVNVTDPISVKDFTQHDFGGYITDKKQYSTNRQNGKMKFFRLKNKVRSIPEAWSSLVPDECTEESVFYKYNFCVPMGREWEPPAWDPKLLAYFEKPPMPWHYDVPLSFCDLDIIFKLEFHAPSSIPQETVKIRSEFERAMEKYKVKIAKFQEENSPAMIQLPEVVPIPFKAHARKVNDEIYFKGELGEKVGYPYKYKAVLSLTEQWYKIIPQGTMLAT